MEICAADRAMDLTARDRSFLRTLMDSESRLQISMKQLEFMKRNPGKDFITRYRYAYGALVLDVLERGAPGEAETLGGLGSAWQDTIARANASGGRLMLDVVTFRAAAPESFCVMPLYTNLNPLEALQLVLSDLPEEIDEWKLADVVQRIVPSLSLRMMAKDVFDFH